MTYQESRAWSETYTQRVLIPFLRQREDQLPFRNLRQTENQSGWLERGLDMVVKADALAERNGTYCLIGIRNQRRYLDERTITVRWPTEYRTHSHALSDPTVARVGYMIHSYSHPDSGSLLAVWVAETRRVIEEIDRTWDRRYPQPYTKVAEEDGQPFAVPRASAIGALRLTLHDQLALEITT